MQFLKSGIVAYALVLATTFTGELAAQNPNFSPEEIDWFEKKVRPLLVEKCHSCHSSSAGVSKGGLTLDSRSAILEGGDSGPSVVPGKPKESLLIEAVHRESFEMPPDKALSPVEVEILEAWVSKKAPWPVQSPSPLGNQDWVQQRRNSHWSWQPLEKPIVPEVNEDHWSLNAIDRFILHTLRENNLEPAPAGDQAELYRRLHFDLTGLPPASTAPNSLTEQQYQSLLEQLLSSPQFGARWGRHWLDLIRYSETLGHEFDYPIHHAWRYRDAVVDSLNSDVPYDRYLQEHIAGDLIDDTRSHPSSGVNQSAVLTGFWFLGDSLHAPTDVRRDRSGRIDNQIDVVSKAFMGMTVACARCHDHKFDAIRTDDYYGMAGILESTRRTYLATDPRHRIAHHNWRHLRRQQEANETARQRFSEAEIATSLQARAWLEQYLSTLKSMSQKERDQQLHPGNPFYFLRALSDEKPTSTLDTLRKRASESLQRFQDWERSSELFADFANGVPDDWRVLAIEQRNPVSLHKDPAHQAPSWWNLYSQPPSPTRRLDWYSQPFPIPFRSSAFASQQLGTHQHLTLQSPRFDIDHRMVCIKLRGQEAISNLVIDGYFMNEVHGLLFKDTRKTINQLDDSGWVTHAGDLNKYLDETAYLSLEDNGEGWFEIAQVRFSDSPPPPEPSHVTIQLLQSGITERTELFDQLADWIAEGFQALASKRLQRSDRRSEELLREVIHISHSHHYKQLDLEVLSSEQDALRRMDAATPSPTLILTATEGDPRDSSIATGGNPYQPGATMPRTCFVDLHETPPAAMSSGRWELAKWLSRPDHPLTARVIVNRVWHHMLGQGLSRTPDNLGVLGSRPTHPELLDYLAVEFVEHDWSLKWLIHEIACSQTYRLSSAPSPAQQQHDPEGLLWSYRPVRRLSAEAIKDSMLAVAGSLDSQLGGKSVPVYLNDQMTGRGRPGKSGPLDGHGRRSIFVEVRRNFLDPFLLAFDFPMPSTSVGKRSVSNVPAQALGMLNDPFVAEMSQRWAKRAKTINDPSERIQAMFNDAYARQPNEDELERCLRFIDSSESQDVWVDLAHILFNSKEFSYLR